MTKEDSSSIQLVCPKCGDYVLSSFNANTGALEAAYECHSLACGWKGNYPKRDRILYSNRTYIEGEQGGKQQ